MNVKRNNRGPWPISRWGKDGQDMVETLRALDVEVVVIGEILEIRLPSALDISYPADGSHPLIIGDEGFVLELLYPKGRMPVVRFQSAEEG